MALQKFANNAQGTLLAAITAGAVSFQLESGEGTEFPALVTGEYCYVRIGSDADNEVVRVTAKSTDTFTCDATAGAWAEGDQVALTISSEILNDLVQQNELAIYSMALARMRGAGSSSSGVFLASGDITIDDDLKVVPQSSPNMTVKVKAGACIVLGFVTGIPADVDVAIAAPPTNNRYTIVQISTLGVISTKHGTEAGSPVAPTVDAGNYRLSTVLLTTVHSDIDGGDITDNRNAI